MTNMEKFLFYCKDLPSPEHIKKLNYLFGVAACVGRKVWLGPLHGSPIFPNIYILFVGPPAVGKSLPATKIKNILTSFEVKNNGTGGMEKAIHLHPDSATFEAMLGFFERCYRKENVPYPKGVAVQHSSMSIILETEFGLLIREENREFVDFLTAGYDCPKEYKRTTKHCGENTIFFPCINMLGCCTDGWMDEKLSNRVISSGFSSRILFAYSDNIVDQEFIFRCTVDQDQAMDDIRTYFEKISTQYAGEIKLSPEAEAWGKELSNNILRNPTNDDKVLAHYYSRRKIHLIKLAILYKLSEPEHDFKAPLSVSDLTWAHKFMLTFEPMMHKALKGGEKKNKTEELGDMVMGKMEKPLSEAEIYKVLMKEVTGLEEITATMDYLQKTDKIKSQVVNNKRIYLRV